MTTLRDSILEGAQEIQRELDTLLEGMDYCLDWKPDPSEWSARELLWHVLEDPEGGIPNTVRGILQGNLPELTIIADETHLNPEREAMDLNTIRGELKQYFADMEEVVGSATDDQLTELKTSCWFPLRNFREDHSAQNLLDGLFLHHWRDHLAHFGHLRQALGLS